MAPAAKRWISRLVKFAVCAGALWYLSDKVTISDHVRLADAPDEEYVLVGETHDTLTIRDPETGRERNVPRSALASKDGQPYIERGLKSIVRSVDWRWSALALAVFGPSTFIMAWRLRLLLATQQIVITSWDALLLTFAGNFFNFSLPGTTGGDIYKAYHIAKRTHKRAEGVTVVFLDRVIGLISFLLLATGTIITLMLMNKEIIGAYGKWVGYFMVAFMIACGLFFSRRVRRWIRYDALLERLPFADKLRRIDETAFSFRYFPGKTFVSLVGTLANHFLIAIYIYFLAHGLGIEPRGDQTEGDMFLACLLATTVGFLFASIPISIQGFGLFEAVFYRVLVEGGWCTASQMIALTLGTRLVQIIWSLPGVAVPWLGFARPRKLTSDDAGAAQPADDPLSDKLPAR